MKRLWYLADKLAQHIRRRAGFAQDGRIDVAALAAALGAEAQPALIQEDGQLVPRPGRSLILYRADHPSQRQRFTIAHELIHLALQERSIGGNAAAAAIGQGGFRSIERLCDCAGAALLMPHWWMLHSYSDRGSNRRPSLTLVRDIAWKADVSLAAAFLRVQGLFGWQVVLLAWVRKQRGWVMSSEAGTFAPVTDVPRFSGPLREFLAGAYAEGTAKSPQGQVSSDIFRYHLPVVAREGNTYLPVEVVVSWGHIPSVVIMADPAAPAVTVGLEAPNASVLGQRGISSGAAQGELPAF